jgi:hypothetical protein
MIKRPAFQFYPGDWLHDSALRCVSIAARGLWIDMICIMHQGTPYGHLTVNGKGLLKTPLSRMEGVSVSELEGLLKELEDAGVFSTTQDGIVFSRRMVRDEALREKRAEGGSEGAEHGKKGGRPRKEKPLDGVMEGVGQGVMEGVISKPLTPFQNNPPSSSSSSSDNNTVAPSEKFTPDFLSFWEVYPRREDKSRAFLIWKARINEGVSSDDLIKAAKNYAAFCKADRKEKKFIKHPKTWLGPDWEEWLEWDGSEDEALPANQTNTRGEKAPPGMKWCPFANEWVPQDQPDVAY